MSSIRDFLGGVLEPGQDVLFVWGSDLCQGKIVAIDGEDVMIRDQEGKVHSLEARNKHAAASPSGPRLKDLEAVASALSQRSNIVRLPKS